MTFGEKINKNFELNPERTPKYSNRSKKNLMEILKKKLLKLFNKS